MKKMFVGGLPMEATEESVTEMFTEYGKVRSIKLASDVFSGKCKGFGFIEMEGHEARAAIAGLNGKIMGDKSLKVQFEEPRPRRQEARRPAALTRARSPARGVGRGGGTEGPDGALVVSGTSCRYDSLEPGRALALA